jgi:hypothetical protein
MAQYAILLFVDLLHRIPLKQAECRTGLRHSRLPLPFTQYRNPCAAACSNHFAIPSMISLFFPTKVPPISGATQRREPPRVDTTIIRCANRRTPPCGNVLGADISARRRRCPNGTEARLAQAAAGGQGACAKSTTDPATPRGGSPATRAKQPGETDSRNGHPLAGALKGLLDKACREFRQGSVNASAAGDEPAAGHVSADSV